MRVTWLRLMRNNDECSTAVTHLYECDMTHLDKWDLTHLSSLTYVCVS